MVLEQQPCFREDQKNDEKVPSVRSLRESRNMIVDVQKCSRCGRTFMLNRRHERCPRCRGVLVSKTLIIKV